MDVFYFDETTQKSVIVYPENCQSCAQCYLNCLGDSITIVDTAFEFSPVPARGLRTFPQFVPQEEATASSSAADAAGASNSGAADALKSA